MAKVFDVYKGEGETEVLDINEYLIKHPASTFFMRLDGPGPDGSDLEAGDVLVIDRVPEPTSGDLVVVGQDGELTINYYSDASDSEEIILWGVVTGLVRKF